MPRLIFGRHIRPWRPLSAPSYWRPNSKEALWLFRRILVIPGGVLLLAAFLNWVFPGPTTLAAIVAVSFLIAIVAYSKLRDEFVYYQDFMGALKRFIAGVVVSLLFVLPYGAALQSILMAALVFAIVNLASIALFTYTRWVNLNDAHNRLVDPPSATYKTGFRPGRPTSASGDQRFGNLVRTVEASRTGWLTLCLTCLTVVGDEEPVCWRCDRILNPSTLLLVSLPVESPVAVKA